MAVTEVSTNHSSVIGGRAWRSALVWAAALLIAALASVGCGSPGQADRITGTDSAATSTGDVTSPTPAAAGGIARELAGRTFVSTAVTGHDLVLGTAIKFEFYGDDRLSTGSGCNVINAIDSWTGDTVTGTQVGMTESSCEKARMDQDQWLADLLKAGVAASLNGDKLTLTQGTTTISLSEQQ